MSKQVKTRIPDRHVPTLEAYGEQHGMTFAQTVAWIVGEYADELADSLDTHYDHLPIASTPEIGALTTALDYQFQTSFDAGATMHAIQPDRRKVTYLEFQQTPEEAYRLWERVEFYYQPLAWMTNQLNSLMRLDESLDASHLDESGDLTAIDDDLLDRLENGGLSQ